MSQKCQLSNCEKVNKIRNLRRQLTIRPKKNCENWWVKTAEEVEAAAVSGDSQIILICETFGRRSSVSERVCNKSGRSILSNKQALPLGCVLQKPI